MLKYWIWLATRKGIGTRGIWLTARHFPSVIDAYYAGPDEYKEIEGLKNIEPLLDKNLSQAERILRKCYEKGISVLTLQDAAYPDRLRSIDDPPVVLYYKGTLPNLNVPAVAVVGTRKASAYGLTQARRMGYGLARCGCAVISGGARGIDTEALKGALTGGGPAVAVLGSGVDVIYPKENKSLFQDVAQNGCLLSEYPPGTEPYAGHFPVRNRLLSALSLGVLVVEAPEKSGALITANRALDQGRDVFVLPANVDVESCSGNLHLLRDGGIPVRDAWDVVQEYVAQYPDILSRQDVSDRKSGDPTPDLPDVTVPANEPERKKGIDKPKNKAYIDLNEIMDTLSADEQRLTKLLTGGPLHIDEIVDRSRMGAGQALASLTLLEVKGIVCRPSSRMYELVQSPRSMEE